MQLDAFLRSAKRYASYASITVLCAGGDLSYKDMISSDLATEWMSDTMPCTNFETVVRWWIEQHERVVFHTDDDVFYRLAPLAPSDVEVFSYRLGLNTVYCHPLDQAQTIPNGIGIMESGWRWRDADGDFGYPLCLNGTVYRSADLLPLLDFPFANPTELEAGLDYRKELFRPEWITAPLHSCCVSLPHNRVSSSSGCRTGSNPAWQPDALRDLYLDGWRIDLDAMDFTQVNAAHVEVPLAFARREG